MKFTIRLTKLLSRLFKKPKRRNKLASCPNEEKNKLHLVLDLDHTLVHTVFVSQLSQKEKYIIEEADSRVDLEGRQRPPKRFLQEANKLFSMHVYTMGSSDYAQTVLTLIDPKKEYFGDRVITNKESPFEKTLDLVEADKRRRVVIVDDTSEVWPDHKRNLFKISKYIYFRDDYDRKSYAEEKRDESRSNGALVNVLKFLKDVHKRFEDQELGPRDLRLLIH
ncbi:hypothetical protein EUTSA_v10027357mg [Eutrema salsugineum]|uniref:RNA polymerase II C-terminal domain phosphatase-like n=1 Tax=Eutrema salsugineum TaxID=72664 RepID=V4LVF2_EUTSA|nr:hypothetical protein EUTSA_v10027357mg [Eutrema salsugineum]